MSNSNCFSQNYSKSKICPLKLLEDRKRRNQENSNSQVNYYEKKTTQTLSNNSINYFSINVPKKQIKEVNFPIFKQKKKLSAKKEKLLEIEKIFNKQGTLQNNISPINLTYKENDNIVFLNKKRENNIKEKIISYSNVQNLSNKKMSDYTSPYKNQKTNADTISKTDQNSLKFSVSTDDDVLAEMTPDYDRYNQDTPIEKSRKNLLKIFQQV
jgi:hypothetical protein